MSKSYLRRHFDNQFFTSNTFHSKDAILAESFREQVYFDKINTCISNVCDYNFIKNVHISNLLNVIKKNFPLAL